VYYGPALGGKTTNLRVLHQHAIPSRRGEFVSVNSMQDRTILCDLLPLQTGGFRGYDLRIQLVAVPGQALYALTRRVVLNGADGVVFVANSASDRWHENTLSLLEMQANLTCHQIDPATIPFVIQYNKRDLPQISGITALERELNPRNLPALPSVAPRGEGVLETLSTILNLTIADLSHRYRTMELPPRHTVQAWTKEAVAGIFGRQRLDAAPPTPQPALEPPLEVELVDGSVVVDEQDQVRVRVKAQEDAPASASAAPQDPRSPDAVAAAYAQASTELGAVVNELREERDATRTRLASMRRACDLAAQPPGSTDVEATAQEVLQILLAAAGASGATLRLLTGRTPRVLPLPPLDADPLCRTGWGRAHLDALGNLAEPMLEEAVESSGLMDALRAGEPSFEAVTFVPVRSAERLLGTVQLYFGPHAVFPCHDLLVHLGFLARELARPLEASTARPTDTLADRLEVLARASAATVASLLARPPAAALRQQRLDLADVLEPLRLCGVAVEVPPDAGAVLGDAPLLRFALASLVRLCDATPRSGRGNCGVVIRAALERSEVGVSVSGNLAAAATPRTDADAAAAELSVVQAVLGLHGATLIDERRLGVGPRFTVQLPRA
jgi:signal recognition particle receptor subunit beta